MFKKLSAIAARPQKPPTRKALMRFLAVQASMLLLCLAVIVFWPDRALALSPFLLMCLGHTAMLWLEAYEKRLGQLDS